MTIQHEDAASDRLRPLLTWSLILNGVCIVGVFTAAIVFALLTYSAERTAWSQSTFESVVANTSTTAVPVSNIEITKPDDVHHGSGNVFADYLYVYHLEDHELHILVKDQVVVGALLAGDSRAWIIRTTQAEEHYQEMLDDRNARSK